jgi:hypothetical protein
MMEEQILKILIKAYPNFASNGRVAKEIADHFREFVEWLFRYDYWMPREGKFETLTIDLPQDKTLDELYQYWNNEIKKK